MLFWLRKNGQEESRLLNSRRLRSSRQGHNLRLPHKAGRRVFSWVCHYAPKSSAKSSPKFSASCCSKLMAPQHRRKTSGQNFPLRSWRVLHLAYPNLLFLAFLDFLAFFLFKVFVAILSVFPFFPKDLRGSASIGNPRFFGGFPCRFPKRQGKEDQGSPLSKKVQFESCELSLQLSLWVHKGFAHSIC